VIAENTNSIHNMSINNEDDFEYEEQTYCLCFKKKVKKMKQSSMSLSVVSSNTGGTLDNPLLKT